MNHLNPLEIAILGLLDGPLWGLDDLLLALCPEHSREDLLVALRRLEDGDMIKELPGRTDGERFFMITGAGMYQRSAQRAEQISLFRQKGAAHAV